MNSIHRRLNPFVLMLDPEAVITAMESSMNLRSLRQRVCRPLDKPLIPHINGDTNAYDQEVDSAPDLENDILGAD